MIYLIRHAKAEDPEGRCDAERRLTDRGRRDAGEAGRALRSKGVALARILTSPLVRARETAELIAAAFDPSPPVEVRNRLGSGAGPEDIQSEINATPGEVAIVGHQPDLGIFVASILGETADGVHFKTSSICGLELGESPRIAWFRNPDDPPS